MTAFRPIIAAAIIALAQAPLFAEYIFLTDGSILDGKIMNESPSEMTVRIRDGKTMTIQTARIMRTIYYDLYIGKIYINKTDGTVLEAFMVDEDQNFYTFRKNLYKPDEFKIRRDEVLFIARKTPTNLTGELGDGSIAAKWNPPYNKVKSYRIYLRAGKGDYSLYRETGGTSCVIGGLEGNTTYAVKVTAVDYDGYESLPSNEIRLRMKNTPPVPPTDVRLEKKPVSRANTGKGKMTVKLRWKAADDACGRVRSYNIYMKKQGTFRLAASTERTEAEIPGLDPNERYSFFVRTVDDTNAESANSREADTSGSAAPASGFAISAAPCFIAPFGKLSQVNGNGFGARVSAIYRGILSERLGAGLSAGFWVFEGKKSGMQSSVMVPLTAAAECRFLPLERFAITPEVRAGYSCNRISYRGLKYSPGGFYMGTTTKTSFEPVASAGLRLEYLFGTRCSAGLGVSCGSVFETGGLQSFAAAECSFGMTF